MDLEKARKDQETDLAEEAQEDALFYPLPGLEPAASTANTTATSNPSSQCVCVRYNSNLPVYNPANARMPRMEDPKVALFRQNSQLASSKKASGSSKRANFQVDYINYLIPGLENIFNCPFYWGKNLTFFTVFENHRKSLIQHCERSELRLHLIKNTKNGPIWRVFENLKLAVKQCYQTGQF